MAIKVYLVDYDHGVVESVTGSALSNPHLGIHIVGSATNYKSTMDQISQRRIREIGIDVFVISVHLPGKSGLALAQNMRRLFPQARILMTIDETTRHLIDQVKDVADDYISKPFYVSNLFKAIREVLHSNDDLRIDYDDENTSLKQDIEEDEIELRSEEEIAPPIFDSMTIMVFSAKGGDGKSTIANNVAAALAKYSDKRVCIVDLDLTWPSVATELNLVGPQPTIADIINDLEQRTLTEERLRQVLVTHPATGLCALLGPMQPEQASLIKDDHVSVLLAYLRQMFDLIVIDSGVGIENDAVLKALLEADRVILVMAPEIPSLQKNARFLELSKRLDIPPHKIVCVLNKYVANGAISKTAVEKHMSVKVQGVVPFLPRELNEASSRGDLLALSDDLDLAKPLLGIAALVYPYLRQPGSRKEKPKARKGLFAKLFG